MKGLPENAKHQVTPRKMMVWEIYLCGDKCSAGKVNTAAISNEV